MVPSAGKCPTDQSFTGQRKGQHQDPLTLPKLLGSAMVRKLDLKAPFLIRRRTDGFGAVLSVQDIPKYGKEVQAPVSPRMGKPRVKSPPGRQGSICIMLLGRGGLMRPRHVSRQTLGVSDKSGWDPEEFLTKRYRVWR
jgi:hypothetical protein